jgi:aminoglycoside 6'-N-acetyltransferase
MMNPFEFRPLCARGQHFSYEDIQNKYLPRIVGNENVPSFIVYQNNDPIGFIQYYPVTNHLPEVPVTGELLSLKNPLFNTYHPNEIAGIDCFIAESNDRGKGKGEQMISAFITEFLKDYRAVIVDPVQDNHPAIRCYEKTGFERTDFSEDKKLGADLLERQKHKINH